MIRLRLKELMLQKGRKSSVYTLMKCGVGRNSAKHYLNGSAKSIKFDDLKSLCEFFNCTPKEIIGVYDEPQSRIQPDTPLYTWVGHETPFPLQAYRQLTPEQLQEASEFINELVGRNNQV
ncbi:MAG: helix-turn-helix transcriptional regulator [Bacteroidota bacterium]